MSTIRTYTCTTCGASLATSAEPGTTIICDYCKTPFTVPAPGLDQPGDSQATVVANFSRRGNPSPMPPTGPDGTPPSTPGLPPDPDSPAGVGNTVDSDALQPMVERGPAEQAPPQPPAAVPSPAANVPEAAQVMPAATPDPAPESEPGSPEIIEELDQPSVVNSPEPEPELPPVAEQHAEEPPAAEPLEAATMIAPLPVPDARPPAESAQAIAVPEGASAADIIAEPMKYGAAVPAGQGEAVVVPPNQVKVVPPQNPVAGGPPGAALRGNNRTPLLIGGAAVAVCCLLGTCVLVVSVILPLFSSLSGS